MNDWLPCGYATGLIFAGAFVAAIVGYRLGRWREQLALLERFRP